jgi:hypothetical protein
MTDYTPDTQEVRKMYVQAADVSEFVGDAVVEFYGSQFDRWLESVKAEAVREAKEKGVSND